MANKEMVLSLEVPRMKVNRVLTLLSVWQEANQDEETAHMIDVVFAMVSDAVKAIDSAMEGK
ncbi:MULTISPECIES: hypothetical protein [Providencia]|uniref:Uncharacterized protein n=2 Tax=Providencia TaxID=586 RepID=A0AAI9GFV9_PROST|nr:MULTISPECIES: hypothetical protein [unclassified Providencia]EJD6474178.1 hypothetical protein [Providencia rettgeri]ELR5111927.1 hypothetical protein [Providencia stuartii]EJD6672374.1 hypothetical protein [Providencia rettgeri]ELR5030243.1 hypothetical protein [Providencia rettgeri]ELR5216427.1 hypothetical protein [Providencia rettgeri]